MKKIVFYIKLGEACDEASCVSPDQWYLFVITAD